MKKRETIITNRWLQDRSEWSRAKHSVFLVALFVVFSGVPYMLINQWSAWRGVTALQVATALDGGLPFVAWMMLPYVSFYLYFPIAAWVGSSSEERDRCLVFFQRMIGGSWMVFTVFLLLPVEIKLRSQVPDVGGFMGFILGLLHGVDAPYNAWPSLHAVLGLLVVLFVRLVQREQGAWSPAKAVFVWTAWSMLIASTMLVKQHYVFDVVTGIVVALVLWGGWIRPALN